MWDTKRRKRGAAYKPRDGQSGTKPPSSQVRTRGANVSESHAAVILRAAKRNREVKSSARAHKSSSFQGGRQREYSSRTEKKKRGWNLPAEQICGGTLGGDGLFYVGKRGRGGIVGGRARHMFELLMGDGPSRRVGKEGGTVTTFKRQILRHGERKKNEKWGKNGEIGERKD